MTTTSTTTRFEIERRIPADAADIFAVLCDPDGHVAIDSTGMLMSATGSTATGVGDTFVVHMDREALGDFDLGKYDVEVSIVTFEPDREIAWTIFGQIKPPIGHVYGYRMEPIDDEPPGTLVTSYYDWSDIAPEWKDAAIFPIISEAAIKATLGILERCVVRGYPRPG
jgi:hypothetical protein